ncbi:chorismate-binding protein, partial [Acinetobacter baumannii]
MGSMTGAPKHRVMQLIATYEHMPRGLFSGAVGYIDPKGDFDFNVVIRSLFYNQLTQQLRYLVGSGITIYSDPATEYEECLLKAKAL